MAPTNAEVVRGMWEGFQCQDISGIDWSSEPVRRALASRLSPDVQLTWSATWAGERRYRGIDGVFQAYAEWLEPFSEYQVEPLQLIEDGDHVAVRNRQWGTGRESGVPVDIEVTHVYEFQDGLITRIDEYDDWDDALAAIRASRAAEG